ncbi:hypothetical protein N136_04911 [Leifsonia aquatica ATCC 14665]|uniref:Uncharacterized protein n=1 Tax=Leifsonia aquatica ATCC 14665 TaxID=1358026 RepID=U2QWK0_LEIAQ|nr:hypothetical protein N136_04911 [Leifsonia aquatica ATCC 14665]
MGPLRLFAAAALLVLSVLGGASAASAHGGGSDAEGYVLVQQAIGYLVNMPKQEAEMHAQEKVTAALAATDQEGVSVKTLEQAQVALRAGDTAQARELLQRSITDSVKMLPLAKGPDTGTGVVLAPLESQQISPLGWAFLAVSLAAIVAGIALVVLFRPPESVHQLRRDMGLASRHLDVGHDETKGQSG